MYPFTHEINKNEFNYLTFHFIYQPHYEKTASPRVSEGKTKPTSLQRLAGDLLSNIDSRIYLLSIKAVNKYVHSGKCRLICAFVVVNV